MTGLTDTPIHYTLNVYFPKLNFQVYPWKIYEMAVIELDKHSTDNYSTVKVPNILPKIEEVKKRVRSTPVTFVIPPSTFLADERVFPFLGILKVAAEFRKNGNPVEVLDLSGYSNYEDIVSDYAKTTTTKHFAITSTTPQLPAAVKIAEKLRSEIPEATIISGGAHATLTHAGMEQDLMRNRRGRATLAFDQLRNTFDKLVIGDGELATFYALDPKYPDQVVDAGNRKSLLFLSKEVLGNFEPPARDLIDMGSYHYDIDGHRTFSTIIQLGCPFECGFCCGRDSHFLRTVRPRSPKNAVEEIEQFILKSKEEGIDYSGVMFYDDELNVSTGNLEVLCRELINLQDRLGQEMAFRGFVKAELFTPKQAELMYHAGFKVLLSGIESGSDQMLKAMKKHTSGAINSHLVDIAHNAGLKVKALMSLGHPGESEKTAEESRNWVINNLWPNWDDVDWTIITQYPGSPYYDHSEYDDCKQAWRYSIIVDGQTLALNSREMNFATDAYYYKGIPGEYDVYVWTDHLSTDQLATLRDQAEKDTRSALKLAPITATTPRTFEHSMGQHLPTDILRRSF